MTAAERLREAFEASEFTSKAELARSAHVEPGTMRAYFAGRFDPPLDVCERLAPLLGFSARWLFEKAGPKRVSAEPSKGRSQKVITVPILDEVAAGRLASPSSQIPAGDWASVATSDLPPSEYFALRVVGNSMDRISPEGSVIIVDRNDRRLVSGYSYVFMLREETTYKMWFADEPPQLHPFSTDPTHRAKAITRKRDLSVIGRVRRTIFDL